MPSSATVNSQSKNYLNRVWSVHSGRAPIDLHLQTRNINGKSLNDELRTKIFFLKSELESERAKVKQTHRDKVAEVKKLRDELENENKRNLDTAVIKMLSSKEIEIKKIRDSLMRDKDLEIKQIIKYKDEEIRALQRNMHEEKERSLRDAQERFNQQLSSRSNNSFTDDQTRKLKLELSELKKSKETLEESCKQHIAIVNEKNEIIKTLKFEHERELQKVLREARRENSRSISEMQQLKKSLSEKTAEVNKLSSFADRVVEEKEELVAQKIRQDHLDVSNDRSLLLNNSDHQYLSPRADREHQLRVKNVELQQQLDSLRKQIKQTEKENANVNVSTIPLNSSVTEKRVKELKRRNAELVQIAKKLEEKAKQSQRDLRDTRNTLDKSRNDTESINSLKKSFAIQRAKDLAEHAQIVLLKDKELEEMRQNKILSQEDQKMFKEIENALQLAAKERLRLERQLSASPSFSNDEIHQLKNELDGVNKKYIEKVEELSSVNNKFQEITVSLESLQNEHSLCEQKDKENEMKLKEKLSEIEGLIQELKEKEEESVTLSKSLLNKDQEMTKLQKEMKEKDREYSELGKTNDMLQSNINIMEENLLELKKQLHASEKEINQRFDIKFCVTGKQLRNENNRLENELFEKNDQCEGLLIKISKLESDVQQFQDNEDSLKEKIKLEEKAKTTLMEKIHSRDYEIRKLQHNEDSLKEKIKLEEKAKTTLMEKIHSRDNEIRKLQHEIEDLSNLRKVALSLEDDLRRQEEQIDNQQKKYEVQSVGLQTVVKEADPTDDVFEDITVEVPKKKISSSSVISDIDVSLQSDILDVVGDRINQLAVSQSEISITESLSELRMDPLNSQRSENVDNPLDTDNSANLTDNEYDGDEDDNGTDVLGDSGSHVGKEDLDSVEQFGVLKENGSLGGEDEPHEISLLFAQFEASLQSKDPIKLFKSNYMYDPSLYSPNEDSHLELPLEVGTLLYVYGDVDEKLQSGKRGLVPSNLIQQLEDTNYSTNQPDGLFVDEDFSEDKTGKQTDVNKVKPDPPIAAEYLSNTSALKIDAKEESLLLDSEADAESQPQEVFVCSPRNIEIERQLQSSVVVAWKPPEQTNDVKGYAIYMNGMLKQNVLGSARTKALVSDIQPDKTYRLSIRTVKSDGNESKDEQAVLTLGKGKAFAPYDLCVSDITSVSAKVSWKPSHSSHYHIVYLNDVEVNKLQPGCYWSLLTNLSPNVTYQVDVQACVLLHKPSPVDWRRSTKFVTMDGFKPEAPLQLDCVVSDGFLNIGWIPVTIQEYGTSNGSVVTGYKMYFNKEERFSVASPTADALSVPMLDLDYDALEIYARTQSSGGESENSNIVKLTNLRKPTFQFVDEDVILPHFGDVVFASSENENENQDHRVDGGVDEEPSDESGERKSVTSFSENQLISQDENRIIISDDDLSVIEEESEAWSPSGDQTKAQYTGTGNEVGTSGTLLDISSENKIFCSEKSGEKSDEPGISIQHIPDKKIEMEHITTDVHAMLKESRHLLNEYNPDQKDNDSTLSSLNDGGDSTVDKKMASSQNETSDMQMLDRAFSGDLENSTYSDSIENTLDHLDSCDENMNQPEKDVDLNDVAKGSTYTLSDHQNKTYSLHKLSSSVDENHNRTYSFNSYIDKSAAQQHVAKQEVSSLQLDSVDMIELLERDAQRDILEDFPDLPFDNVNPERLDYPDPSMKQLTEQSKDNEDEKPKTNPDILQPIDNVKEIPTVSDLTPTEDTSDTVEIDSSLPLSSLQLSSLKSSVDTEPTNQMSSEISQLDDDDDVNRLLELSISSHRQNVGDTVLQDDVVQNEFRNDSLDNIDQASDTISDVNLQNDALQVEENAQCTSLVGDVVDSALTKSDAYFEQVSPTPEQAILSTSKNGELLVPDNIDENTSIPAQAQSLPVIETVAHHKESEEHSVDLVESEKVSSKLTESLKIPKPLTNLYNFASVEVSSPELTVTENDVSEIVDDEEDHEFDVTPINTLDDSNESGISILNVIDQSKQFPSVNVQSMIGQIEGDQMKPLKDVPSINVEENMTEFDGLAEAIDEQIKVRIFIALYPYNPYTMSPNVEYVEDELAFEQGALMKVYGDVDEDGFYFGELDGVTGLVPSNMVHEVKVDQPTNSEQDLGSHGDNPSSQNKTDSFDVSFLLDRKQKQGNHENTPALETVSISSAGDGKKHSKGVSVVSSSYHDVSSKIPVLSHTQDKAASMPDIYQGRKDSVPIDVYKLNPVTMVALFDYDPDVSSPNVDAEIELAFRAGEVIYIYGEMDEDGFYSGMAVNGRKGLVPSNFVRAPDGKDKSEWTADEKSENVPKIKKKNSFFKKGKKILSKLKGGKT